MWPVQLKLRVLWPSEACLLPEVELQNVINLEMALRGLNNQWVTFVPRINFSLDKNRKNTTIHLAKVVKRK